MKKGYSKTKKAYKGYVGQKIGNAVYVGFPPDKVNKSGKFEIYSNFLKAKGFNPLPSYLPIPEHQRRKPDELILTTYKVNIQTHSRTQNCKWLTEIYHDNPAKSSVLVKRFVENLGLEYPSDYKGIPDSLNVELEVMQKLAIRESEAWEKEDTETAKSCIQLEKRFIDEHLSQWIPAFCDQVRKSAGLSFYREMAGLMRNFIQLEKEQILKLLAKADKFVGSNK